jgi:N6-adenosine-specific RNA methylase IME4
MTTLQRMDMNPGPYELTVCGLELSGDSTPQQWEECGKALRQVDEARQWAIGDWLCDGKRHYGDGLYKKAQEITGLDSGTLRQFASLSSRFELLSRNNNLTFKHHREVASIKLTGTKADDTLFVSDDSDAVTIHKLLAKAERRNWTTRELQSEVPRHKQQQQDRIRLANEPEKYAAIYADPPWKYGDERGDVSAGGASAQYPLMELSDICELPVGTMAASDSVLFMWATAPLLPEAMEVIEAWGFTYKTHLVWDKGRPFYGNYSHVQHELLMVCTRGSCTPHPDAQLSKSIIAIDRSEHSAKPHEFYDLIEEMYPEGNRIELFARNRREGWDAYGNQIDATT